MDESQDKQNRQKTGGLFERLKQLPVFFFEELKEEFSQIRSGSSWSRISHGKMDFNIEDHVWIAGKIGCLVDDLLNPHVDLLDIYIKAKEIQDGKEFGLAPPQKSSIL